MVQRAPIVFICSALIEFQYIKCDGSAITPQEALSHESPFQYIKCDGSATAISGILSQSVKFQYIKCDGSAKQTEKSKRVKTYFNTSNVMVQHGMAPQGLTHCLYFNTSNVMVQPGVQLPTLCRMRYFNTSNVMVQRKVNRVYAMGQRISIHQMWWFSFNLSTSPFVAEKFQYIKCDGSARPGAYLRFNPFLFQYIKCDGSA